MFFARGAKRVHVCTPSNTAADEVMLRLSKPGGLVGIKDSDRDKMLLRVGASEYEALFPEIQKYSLEDQMTKLMRYNEEKELKERRNIL